MMMMIGPLVKRLECLPMARETRVQSQVESYQRLKKWYLIPPCLTLSIIRYGSRIKWSNPGKEIVPFPTPWCSRYRKGSLQVILDYDYLFIYNCLFYLSLFCLYGFFVFFSLIFSPLYCVAFHNFGKIITGSVMEKTLKISIYIIYETKLFQMRDFVTFYF